MNDTIANDEKRELHDSGRWLAFLRVIVGLWFVKALWSKLVLIGGFLPVPIASARWIETMPRIVTGYLPEHPLPWYKGFLEQTVLTHATLFGNLTALGEVAVGLGLVTGFLGGLAAMIGLVIMTAYVLAGLGLPFPRQGLRLIIWCALLAFLFARASRVGGVDGWLARRYPGSFLTRFPLS